jgi:hypothetical protein
MRSFYANTLSLLAAACTSHVSAMDQAAPANTPVHEGVVADVPATSQATSCTAPSFSRALVDATKGASAAIRGTVTKLGAVTEGVDGSDPANEAIVRLDAVVWAKTPFLSSFVNQAITIVFAPGSAALAEGDAAFFFVRNGSFGRTVELDETLHVRPDAYPTFTSDVPSIAAIVADEAVSARIASARVVTGTVTSARTLPSSTTVSEHDPLWGEAELKVDRTLRGAVGPDTVRVRFATSDDIAWVQAPKLAPGEQGVFLLQKDDRTGLPGPATLVVDPLDVAPLGALAHIADLVACPPSL